MIDNEEAARAFVAELAPDPAAAMARLERFIPMLVAENARQNLVAEASLAHVWQRHIADSAQLLSYVPRETLGPWLDLGTGAGFPGLVIAIIDPDREVIMVESRARRIAWLEEVCAELGLARAKVEGRRLELVPPRPVGVISARAFAPMTRLVPLSAPFSTEDTIWLLPKGRSAAQDLAELSGWRHMFHVEQSRTDPEAGLIVGRLQGPAATPPGRKAARKVIRSKAGMRS